MIPRRVRFNSAIVIGAFVALGAGCGGSLTVLDGGGGAAGTGGGPAGHGGSAGGAGGGTVDAGSDIGLDLCGQYAAHYGEALMEAQRCDVGATGQCQQMASISLSPCFLNCTTYVNDATPLDAIKQSWLAAGCDNVKVLCPAIACVLPMNAMCIAADGGAGVCSGSTPVN